MPAIQWVDDDAGYEAWLETHTDGFLANLRKEPTVRYYRIHRATCHLPDRSLPGTKNPRTGNMYSKVTAEQIGDLISWAKKKLPGIKFTERNYCKICSPLGSMPIESEPTADLNEYVRRADQIRAKGHVSRPLGTVKPKIVQSSSATFFRDPKVRAWVLQRAEGMCELCGKAAPFLKDDGLPFLESHHLVWLVDGGADTPENTVALCPNCHRKLHHGADRKKLSERLLREILKKESGR